MSEVAAIVQEEHPARRGHDLWASKLATRLVKPAKSNTIVSKAGQPLAEIYSYEDLVQCMRARAVDLRMSRKNIDHVAGWADRLASKLLSPNPVKRMGAMTLQPMLAALGIKLLAVEDPVTLERHRDQREPRAENQVRTWMTWGDPVC